MDLQGWQGELEVGPHVLVDVNVGPGGHSHCRDPRLSLKESGSNPDDCVLRQTI